MTSSGSWTTPWASKVVATVAIAVALVGCGAGNDVVVDGDRPLSEAEFVARADRICLETSSHFDELPEPVGGAKPVGLGTFMRTWIAKLRVPKPPQAVVHDWKTGLDLLDRAADKLDDAEAGDPEAQSEALWNLEPRAQAHQRDARSVPRVFRRMTRCTRFDGLATRRLSMRCARCVGSSGVVEARGVPGPGRRGGDSGCDAGARAEILPRTDAADLDME